MNKIFKVIFNRATGKLVVVSELTKSNGKAASQTDERSQPSGSSLLNVGLAGAVMLGAALMASNDAAAWSNLPDMRTLGSGVDEGTVVAIGSYTTDGSKASALGNNSTTIGRGAVAGTDAVALGRGANASTGQSVALGSLANATEIGGTAVGYNATSGSNAVAMGWNATANSREAVVIGYNAAVNTNSTGSQSVAIGSGTVVNTSQAIGIGNQVIVDGYGAIALGGDDIGTTQVIPDSVQGITGFKAQYEGNWSASDTNVPYGEKTDGTDSRVYVKTAATGRAAIAMGAQAQATANWTTAIGTRALANKEAATAVGMMSKATGNASFAGGLNATASNNYTTATGANATALGDSASAYGYNATSTGKNSVAVGKDAASSGPNTTTMGMNATALNESGSAYGYNASSNGANSVAVGKDALAARENATSIGMNAQALGNNTIAIGRDAVANTQDVGGLAIGKNANATGKGNFALGTSAFANYSTSTSTSTGSTEYAMAIGDTSRANATRSLALGVEAKVHENANGAVAIGNGTSVSNNSTSAIAIGNISKVGVGSDQAVAIGYNANVTGNAAGSILVGGTSTVQSKHAVALGYNTSIGTGKQGAVVLGANSRDTGSHTIANVSAATVNGVTYTGFAGNVSATDSGAGSFVSVGNSSVGGQRKIINVAAGNVSTTSTEAINGSQLYAVASQIGQNKAVVKAGTNTTVSTAVNATTGGTDYTVDISEATKNDITNIKNNINSLNSTTMKYFSVNSSATVNRDNTGATGTNAIAAGANTSSTGTNAIAIGHNTTAAGQATGQSSYAIGSESQTVSSIAIGNNVQSNNGTVAVGSNIRTGQGQANVILGRDINVSSSAGANILMGTNVTANGTSNGATGIGNSAVVSAENALAVGQSAKSLATRAVAIGTGASSAGDNSIAIGWNSSVPTGVTNAIAIGTDSRSSGNSGTAVGNAAHSAKDATAFGVLANASGEYGTALGTRAHSTNNSVAVGYWSAANGTTSVAVGNNTKALGNKTTAIGVNASAAGENAIAIGNGTSVIATASNATAMGSYVRVLNSTNATAIGSNTYVDGNSADAVVLGSNSSVGVFTNSQNIGANQSIVVGSNSYARSNNVTVLGSGVTVNQGFDNAVVLGANSNVNGSSSIANVTDATVNGITYSGFAGTVNSTGNFVSVGSNATNAQRKIINVAAGNVSTTSTEAINGSQLYAVASQIGQNKAVVKAGANTTVSTAVNATTGGTDYTVDISDATKNDITNIKNNITTLNNSKTKYFSVKSTVTENANNAGATGTNAIAIGPNASSVVENGIAIGTNVTSGAGNQINTIAIGYNSSATLESAVAYGANTRSSGIGSVAIGRTANASTNGAIAIGVSSQVISGNHAIVIGDSAKANGTKSLALGVEAKTNADYAIALGNKATANGTNSVALGNSSTALSNNVTVLGSGVTVNQGFDNAVVLGANSNVNGSHTIANVTEATVNGITYSGFAGTVNSTGNFVSVGGSEAGQQRKIINVAAGAIDQNSTEAINGSQLYAVAKSFEDSLKNLPTTLPKNLAEKLGLPTDSTGNVTNDLGIPAVAGSNTAPTTLTQAVKDVAVAVNKGISIRGNDAQGINKTLGETFDIVGSHTGNEVSSTNIKTRKTDDGKLEIVMAEKPEFKGATIGENGKPKTVIGENGVEVKKVDGTKGTVLGPNGLDNGGNKITNVMAGSTDNDAVNYSQLKSLENTLNQIIGTPAAEEARAVYDEMGRKLTSGDVQGQLSKTTEAVNKGIKYGGEMPDDYKALTSGSQEQRQQLGSKLSVVATSSPLVPSTGPKANKNFVGDNLVTKYTRNEDGSGTIAIGLSDKPEFKEVTVKDPDNPTKSTTLKPTGTVVTDGPKEATYGVDGIGLKGDDGKTTKLGRDENGNLTIQKEGEAPVTLATQGISGSGKDGKDGKDATDPTAAASKGATAQDGLNGKDLTTKVNALRNGEAGPVVYTNAAGERLVKANNGQYYPADQVEANGEPKTGATPEANPIASVVNPDGTTTKPTTMGNVKSTIGLNGKDATGADSAPITADAAKNAVAGADGQSGLLAKKGAELNNVATVGDLQAIAQAGLDFTGNNSDTTVHRPLGTKLTVVGERDDSKTAYTADESAKNNLIVEANATTNTLTVKMAKDLKNLKSIEASDTIKVGTGNETTTIAKDGTSIKGADGKSADYKLDGTTVTAKDASGNPITTTVKADGVTATDKDSKNTVNADGMTVKGNDDKDAIALTSTTGTDGKTTNALTLEGKDGKDAVSITSGKDGEKPEISFAKDGNNGTGSITGLKDVERKPDGTAVDRTAAANAGYVDDRLAEVNAGKPFEYFDEDGNQVVRGKDGKFYDPKELEGKVYDPTTKQYYPAKADGTADTAQDPVTDKPASEVVIKAMPNEAGPVAMGNVGSGLGLDAYNGKPGADGKTIPAKYDATKAEDVKAAQGAADKLYALDGDKLNNVVTAGDLQALAVAGLDFTGDNNTTTVHRPLGTKLTVEGEGNWNGANSATDNLYVEANATTSTLTVKMNSNLTGLNKVGLKGADGNVTTIGRDVDGNLTVTNSKDGANPQSQKLVTEGNIANMKGTDGKDGKDGTDATSAGAKGLTGKDGLNGASLDDKINALRNGEAGPVVYTDAAGKRLEKANDGKYYLADQVNPDGTTVAGATPVASPIASVVNSNGSTTDSVKLGNIANATTTYGDNGAVAVPAAKAGIANLDAAAPNTALTVADAKNLGWVLSTPNNNNYNVAVNNADQVSFVGTGGVNVSGKTNTTTGAYEVEVALSEAGKLKLEEMKAAAGDATLATNAGKVAVEANDAGFVGAKNIADMINGAGWKTNSTTATGGAKDTLISAGNVVNFEAGKNIQVTQTVNATTGVSYTYATKDKVSFDEITLGDAANGTTTITNAGTVVTKFDPTGNATTSSTYGADGLSTKALDPKTGTVTGETTVSPTGVNLYGKDGKDGKDAKPVASLTNTVDTAGNNNPSLSFAKDDAGNGTGKVTGLKDVERNLDGTAKDRTQAANAGYVDDRLAEVNAGKPFEYFEKDPVTGEVKTDANGKPVVLVRGQDGKFYKDGELDGKTFDEATGTYKNADGTPLAAKPVDSNNVTVQAMPSPTGAPIEMGNVGSGLGLDDSKDGNKTPLTADVAKEAIGGADGKSGLLGKTGDTLNNIATVKDLQALAQSGLDFTGNNSDTTVHRPLSTKLTVKGEGAWDGKNSAADNLYVEAKADTNELVVKMNKDLTGLSSVETTDAAGNVAKMTAAGTTVKDAAGNSATYGANGLTVADKDGNPTITLVNSATGPSLNFAKNADGTGTGKITGVAAGDITPDSTDVVTGAQIYAFTGGLAPTANHTIKNQDGSTTNVSNVVVAPVEHNVVNADGTPKLDAQGNPITETVKEVLMKTYNVYGNTEYVSNSAATAIYNMNEQGIKFFHTNDGTARPEKEKDNEVDSSASGVYATAVGVQAQATGTNAIAMGKGATAKGENSIAIGTGNQVEASKSGAFGDPNIIMGTTSENDAVSGSYAIGNDNVINSSNTFVLGNDVNNRGNENGKPVAMGDTVENSVYLGNKTTATAGDGSKTGTLKNRKQDGTEGTTTTAGSTGTVSTATVGNMTYGGFAGAKADGVVSVGAAGNERRIQNVAAGEISATSTDAINGSQLYSVAQGVDNLDHKVNRMNRKLRSGIAAATAMTNIPQVTMPGKSAFGAGLGSYDGQGALAVGYSRMSDNGRVIFKATAGASTQGKYNAGVGVAVQW